MTANEKLIHNFYTAFQNKDYAAMQQCYGDRVNFNDPVFQNLNASQVKFMWEMFCVKGKDLNITFKNIKCDDQSGSAEWIASYTFSSTGNKVLNHIKANFTFENNKIIRHTDHFSFYNWSKQALGLSGLLLGWTPFIKNKVRKSAMKSLEKFIDQKLNASHKI